MRYLIIFLCAECFAVSPTITNFNTGQTSPLLEARVNYQKYNSSSRTLENMIVTSQGPVKRRPGTKYIASQKAAGAAGRLISYEHSVDDTYILSFENEVIRFFRDGAQILEAVGTDDLSALDAIVAQWKLNETEGRVVLDSENGRTTETTVDIDLLTADGIVGRSFDIDGQYIVRANDHPTFSFTDNSDDEDFSIACWGYVEDKNGRQVLVSKWENDSTSAEWSLSLTSARRMKLLLADNSANVESDRVAQWNLNDDVGNKIVLDEDASSHDGLTQTDFTSVLTRTGKIGKCLNFGDADAVVLDSDSDELSFVASPMSIAAWIYVTIGGNGDILTKYDNTTGAKAREWRLTLQEQKLQMTLYDESEDGWIRQDSDTIITTGWHFVTGTYDGGSTASSISLYMDSVPFPSTGSSYLSFTAMENLGTLVIIGGLEGSGGTIGNFYDDKIDAVVLFDIELTRANIIALHSGGDGTETLSASNAVVGAITDDAISIGWHLFTSTYEPDDAGGGGGLEPTAADGIILYVDGVAVDSTASNDATYTAMQDTAERVRIGSEDTAKYWAERIDEVSIYSDILTPAEIASLYSTTPFEIESPYQTADLFDIDFIKSEDAMFFSHPDYEPRQLLRSGHTIWSLTAIATDDGPFQAENADTTIKITPSGITGAITLTATKELFKSGHVGALWGLNHIRENSTIEGTFTTNGTSITSPQFTGSYGFTTENNTDGTITLQRSTNNGISWRPALSSLTDVDFDNPTETEDDVAIYRVVMSGFGSPAVDPTFTLTITDSINKGIVRITGVDNGLSATATVLVDLSEAAITRAWREGYWSDYRGWPQTVSIHQQRLVFGGSPSFPQTMWFGKTDPDDYTNFAEGTLDTSSFIIALSGNNPIQWLLSQDYLLIGTAGSCGKYGEQGAAITPTSPSYQEQTKQGVADIRGILAGDTVLYVERGSRNIREFSFNLQFDKYLSPDLSVLSPEITESGIKDVAFQTRPFPVLWCVLNNGDIATLTYLRDQSIIAWTKQITDGDFESVAVIPATAEDEVWVSVKRTIDGDTETVARYIEQFQPIDWGSDPNDAWFVDSGLSYDGVATDSFTGADHLDGETMSIYADLLIESTEVPTAGAFTIDNAALRVLVGLPYTSKLETLPLVVSTQDRAANKKIRVVSFDFYETGACEFTNGSNGSLSNINFKNSLILDENATAQDFYTSVTSQKRVTWPYGSMKKQTVYIETDQPMPLTLRSITTDYKVYP